MKKILLGSFVLLISLSDALAQKMPNITGEGGGNSQLPWGEFETLSPGNNSAFEQFINVFVSEFIQFVAAVAVITLMISGIFLILSGGEEERFKKAKLWFIRSLIGVIVSLSAWFLITGLNNLQIF